MKNHPFRVIFCFTSIDTFAPTLNVKNMKKLILIALVLSLFSCSPSDETSQEQQEQTDEIYVGGYEKNSFNVKVAKYWKNGQENVLGNGAKDSEVKDVTFNGADFYAVGYQTQSNDKNSAALWKNGELTYLTANSNVSNATSIIIANGDVYVGGNELINGISVAKIWKNGVGINLSDGSKNTSITDVFVNGTDVYACGIEQQSIDFALSKVWKNASVISNLNNQFSAYATNISVDNNEIYVSGSSDDVLGQSNATYWVNGISTNLGSGTCNGLYTKDGNLVLAINSGAVQIYKNGIRSTIHPQYAMGRALFVKDVTTYIAGTEYIVGSNNTKAKLWINNVGTDITNGTSEAQLYSVCVK